MKNVSPIHQETDSHNPEETYPALTLLLLALLLYLATRFVFLLQNPTSFTADEAVSTVLGSEMLRAWRNGPPFPLPSAFYYYDGGYSLGVSVYLQAIFDLVLGRSALAARALVILAGAAGAAALGRFARHGLGAPAWLPVLLLAGSAGWFTLSRSAEVPVLLCALVICALEAYRVFRQESRPSALYVSLAFASLAFYTSPPGRWSAPVALLLMLFDPSIRSLGKAEKIKAGAMLLFFSLPLILFIVRSPQVHPLEWLAPGARWAVPGLRTSDRLIGAWADWIGALDPRYWFLPPIQDGARYAVPGNAYLSPVLIPFIAAGIWSLTRQNRPPAARLTLLAAGLSTLAALGGPGTLGVRLPILVSLCLFAAQGLSVLMIAIERRTPARRPVHLIFIILAVLAIVLPAYAVPGTGIKTDSFSSQSFLDYDAEQLFSTVQDYLTYHSSAQAAISTGWTKNADILRRFFAPELAPIGAFPLASFMRSRNNDLDHYLFVMTPSDYLIAKESGRFYTPQIMKTLNHPDGSPSFYFVKLEYAPGFDALIAAEAEEAFQQTAATVHDDVGTVEIRHSRLRDGEAAFLFDNDTDSGLCTEGNNPLVVEVRFSEPRASESVIAEIGNSPTRLRVTIDDNPQNRTIEVNEPLALRPRSVRIPIPEGSPASSLNVEVSDLSNPPLETFCLYELKFVSEY